MPYKVQQEYLAEIHRVLRPDGRLIVYENTYDLHTTPISYEGAQFNSELVKINDRERLQLFLAGMDTLSQAIKDKHQPFPFTYRTISDWKSFFEKVGFYCQVKYYGIPSFDLYQAPLGIFILTKSDLHMEIRQDIQYSHSSVSGDEQTHTVFINLHNAILKFFKWNQRKATPFTPNEIAIFDNPRFQSENLSELNKDDIKTIQHTSYDRSSGDIEIRIVVTDIRDKKHFYKLKGSDTTSMAALKNLMPTLPEMNDPKAIIQTSIGNQGDLEGNFTVLSHQNSWELYGAVDEPWKEKSYRALVQFSNGQRRLGIVHFKGDPQGHITEIYFNSNKLAPEETSFVFIAYTLGWEDENPRELLKQDYEKTSDLRHIFRFPYLNGSVFHGQVASSSENLNTAFAGMPVDLRMVHQGKSISRTDLENNLNIIGYQLKGGLNDVRNPGDYFIEGNNIRIVFLPARYPVNTLVVDDEGHMAFVAIQGKSGQKGADYWTVGNWVKEEVQRNFGWGPRAVFALDNGMDPFLKKFDEDGKEEILLGGARENLNASFSVVPAEKDSSKEDHAMASAKRSMTGAEQYLYRPFGKTGLTFFIAGHGAIWTGRKWPTNNEGYAKPNQEEVFASYDDAFEYMRNQDGVVMIDTAPAYGEKGGVDLNSEEWIGEYFKKHPELRQKAFISTKVGEESPQPPELKGEIDHSVEHLKYSVDRSLERLGRIDLLYIHQATAQVLTDKAYKSALLKMKQENYGGIKFLGASISDKNALEEAVNHNLIDWLDAIQIPAWLFNERKDLVQKIYEKGIAIVINSAGRGVKDNDFRSGYLNIAHDPRVSVILVGSRGHLAETVHYFTSHASNLIFNMQAWYFNDDLYLLDHGRPDYDDAYSCASEIWDRFKFLNFGALDNLLKYVFENAAGKAPTDFINGQLAEAEANVIDGEILVRVFNKFEGDLPDAINGVTFDSTSDPIKVNPSIYRGEGIPRILGELKKIYPLGLHVERRPSVRWSIVNIDGVRKVQFELRIPIQNTQPSNPIRVYDPQVLSSADHRIRQFLEIAGKDSSRMSVIGLFGNLHFPKGFGKTAPIIEHIAEYGHQHGQAVVVLLENPGIPIGVYLKGIGSDPRKVEDFKHGILFPGIVRNDLIYSIYKFQKDHFNENAAINNAPVGSWGHDAGVFLRDHPQIDVVNENMSFEAWLKLRQYELAAIEHTQVAPGSKGAGLNSLKELVLSYNDAQKERDEELIGTQLPIIAKNYREGQKLPIVIILRNSEHNRMLDDIDLEKMRAVSVTLEESFADPRTMSPNNWVAYHMAGRNNFSPQEEALLKFQDQYDALLRDKLNDGRGFNSLTDFIEKMASLTPSLIGTRFMDQLLRTQPYQREPIKVIDKAQLVKDQVGGIDLNSENMQMDVSGQNINIHFDSSMIAQFRRGDFSGVRPLILSITPIANIMPWLGFKVNPMQLAKA